MTKKIMHIYRPMGDGNVTTITEYEKREVDKCPSLSELQELVDGLIELVRVNFEGKEVDMIINEEGLIHNLPFNATASRLMRDSYDGYGYIVGPAIVFEGFKLP